MILPPLASSAPSRPSSRGIENPQMSASRIPTCWPCRARATARLAVTDDLPTPPFPEEIPSTRALEGRLVAGAAVWAIFRAVSISCALASGSSCPITTSTPATPSMLPADLRTSSSIWPLSGQAAVVSATVTVAMPSFVTEMSPTIPSSTMLAPSSGSMTPWSCVRTSSAMPGWVLGSVFSSIASTYRRAPPILSLAWVLEKSRWSGPSRRPRKESDSMTVGTAVNIGSKPDPVTLSDKAAAKVAELLSEEEGGDTMALRVAVKSGGCSGFSYDMYFDSEFADDDVVRTFGTIKVVVDPQSAEMLSGSSLDYADGLNGAGFNITNPNATRTCGCGSSFS